MTELLKTTTSLGKLTIDETHVTIKTLAKKRMFGRDKVVEVTHGIGGGSVMFTHTVTMVLLGGEKIILRNVPSKKADEMQRLLS